MYFENNEIMKEKLAQVYNRLAYSDEGSMCWKLNPQLISCDAETLRAVSAFKTCDWMRNPQKFVHGGLVGAMFDTVMGYLAIAATDCFATPTITMETSYLRPVPINDTLIISCTLDFSGKKLGHVTAKGWMESAPDKLVATATAAYYHV